MTLLPGSKFVMMTGAVLDQDLFQEGPFFLQSLTAPPLYMEVGPCKK